MTPQELEEFLEKYDLENISFAEIIGVNEQTVKSWLNGKRKIPNTTAKLVRFFDKNQKAMETF